MTILNNDLFGNYVAIQPITAVFTDTTQANVMVADIVSDNLTNGCVIRYRLCNLVTDDTGTSAYELYGGTLAIEGNDYMGWGGDSQYVYTYIAGKIPITII